MISTFGKAYEARIAKKSTQELIGKLEELRIYEGHEAETKRIILMRELRKRAEEE